MAVVRMAWQAAIPSLQGCGKIGLQVHDPVLRGAGGPFAWIHAYPRANMHHVCKSTSPSCWLLKQSHELGAGPCAPPPPTPLLIIPLP